MVFTTAVHQVFISRYTCCRRKGRTARKVRERERWGEKEGGREEVEERDLSESTTQKACFFEY